MEATKLQPIVSNAAIINGDHHGWGKFFGKKRGGLDLALSQIILSL
jgi:hypothetical protein